MEKTTRLVKAAADAVDFVFQDLAQLPLKTGKAYALDPAARPPGQVGATVPLAGSGIRGSLSIAFGEADYFKIVSRILRQPIPGPQDELRDGAGELLEMVLCQLADDPTLKADQLKRAPAEPFRPEDKGMVIPLSCEHGSFALILSHG